MERLCSHGQMLHWGEPALGHVRAVVIVGPQPPRGEALNLFNAGPAVVGQPFAAHRPVEPLNVGVLLWLSWLDVFDLDSPFFGPVLHHSTDVFRPVVATNRLRLSAPGNDLFQRSDHLLTRQREVQLDAQGFPVEVVDHID